MKKPNYGAHFICEQAIVNSITGAFQHAKIYSAEASDKDKEALRKALASELRCLRKRYSQEMGALNHCDQIRGLAKKLTDKCSNSLRDGQFRVGVAQKALNLHLKYLWLSEFIPTPPHCPIDRKIIDKLRAADRRGLNWTTLTSIEDYCYLIGKLREIAGAVSLAQWELKHWKF